MKEKRPRIKTSSVVAISDELYGQNAASKNAKLLFSQEHLYILEIWIDKHYTNRKNWGDDTGYRENIEEESVTKLITKSFRHLFYYSLKHERFSFVNFPPPALRSKRIILTEANNFLEDLNVVAEYQFLELNKFEVTVITAMRKNNFKVSDNQYNVQFDGDNSYLMVCRNKKMEKIDEF